MTKREQRKLHAKWENILKKKGLGVVQPLTDNSDGEMANINLSPTDEMDALRKQVDGGDNFMDGHQIMKIRGLDREVPNWALDDEKVRRLIQDAFPGFKTKKKVRVRAGHWLRIIQLYYRMRLPQDIVAKEVGITVENLWTTLRDMNRVSRGLTTKNRPRLRKPQVSDAPVREVGDKDNESIVGSLLPTAREGGN